MKILFNPPRAYTERHNEILKVSEWGINGKQISDAQSIINAVYPVDGIFMTNSATSALEMMAWSTSIKGEILMPSWNFASAASVFLKAGWKIRFCDVDPKSLCVTAKEIRARITPATKAVMVVHYGGVTCPDYTEIASICHANNVMFLEDAAPAYGCNSVASLSNMSAFSFNDTKNIGAGEGGALLVRDDALMNNLNVQAHKGTNFIAYKQYGFAYYSWWGHGGMPLMTNLQAAALLPELESTALIIAKRQTIWDRYFAAFTELPEFTTSIFRGNGHSFWVMAPNDNARYCLQQFLAMAGIQTSRHYFPLHLSAGNMVNRVASDDHPMYNTMRASDCIVRLPLYTAMTEEEVDYVIEQVHKGVRLAILATSEDT